jgi:hypothetical protein
MYPGVFLQRNAMDRRSGSSSSEVRKPERRSGNYFPGIDITNTSPYATEFSVTMRSGTYFIWTNVIGSTYILLFRNSYYKTIHYFT